MKGIAVDSETECRNGLKCNPCYDDAEKRRSAIDSQSEILN